MKISKLFHWLYVCLMFLPLLMFLPSALYYGFNEHAVNETTTEVNVNYKYQSNEVNSVDDLVQGNIYQYDALIINTDIIREGNFEINLYKFDYNEFFSDNYEIDEIIIDNFNSNNYNSLYLSYAMDVDENYNIYLHFTNDFVYSSLYFSEGSFYLDLENVVFSIISGQSTFIDYHNTITDTNLPKFTDYNEIESVEVIENVEQTISQQMYKSWQSVWNLPIFAWTHNSFVSAPFTYITGLFGLSADNTLNYVFTYFCSISICWLVFDLLMYVPNLAHRWLDKGAIE